MPTISTTRAASVMIVIIAMLTALVGRVAYLQTIGRQQTIRRAEGQQHQNQTMQARRGCIFDSNGILMAGTVQTNTLYIDPKFTQDRYQEGTRSLVEMDDDIAKLAKLIDRKPYELSELLSRHSSERYLIVADNLDETTVEAIRKLNIPGIGIGKGSILKNCIVDKNAHIGAGVRILNEAGIQEKDGPGYYIRDGIVIVPKNGVLPDGTVV